MSENYDVIVVGAGIFGATAALELVRRGHNVALLDPGPIPHPLAASTDISKVIRMEYGSDVQYMAMVEAGIEMWHSWNAAWTTPLYHETGVSMLTREPMQPGSYEYESYQLLLKRGHKPDRLDADEIARRFPAWRPGAYVDGYYHARGGFAESGKVVSAVVAWAQQAGVTLLEGQALASLIRNGDRVEGVVSQDGQRIAGGHVLVAAGSWTYLLVPELAPFMKATGHPVFHLQPANPGLFASPNFAVFTADINRTGWYGFPYHPYEKVVKIANHGIGVRLHPTQDERVVTADDVAGLRAFLADTFPSLVDAPIVYTRRCLYADTLDEHFWIDRHPEYAGLTVATGGSGHGFKFAPVLGPLIADAVEGKPNEWLAMFRWRDLAPETGGEEAARHH